MAQYEPEQQAQAAEIERLQTDLRIAHSAVDHLTERAEKAEERLAEAEEVGMYDAECLAAISTLLVTDNGQIPEHFACKRPGLQRALKWAQYRHAWVVCGPVPDGMERLLLKLDKEVAQARADRWKKCAKRQRRYDRHMIAIGDGWREERDQARAEVARLRAVLAEIARLQPKEEETQ